MVAPRVAREDLIGADLLVRGDMISFVSAEQADRTGVHSLNDQLMPSDIVLPEDYVLVQDPTGKHLSKCDFYVVRWFGKTPKGVGLSSKLREIASDYFGDGARIKRGSVELPEGDWNPVAEIAFIRYRRAGELSGNYEHPYNPKVQLYETDSPLAWRLPLPTGCVVDARGFVWP